MATQLGLQGTGISEGAGGAGLGLAECMLVHEELGRALYGGPFLGTVGQVVPGLQAASADPATAQRLELIAAGALTAAAAIPLEVPADGWDLRGDGKPGGQARSAFPVTLAGSGSAARITGSLSCVIDAPLADGFLVAAAGPGGLSLLWTDASGPGVRVDSLETVDLTRRMGRVSFDSAPAELVADPQAAGAALAAMRRGLMLALVAECVGVAARALELTVGYVRTRHQFGRPIGSFQAVKHKCADLLILLEAARSALELAITPGASETESEARLAAVRICAGEAAFAIANETIHLHGGIGFTWEYPAHLYYRRAKPRSTDG